jgi:hypothetical protein
VNTQNGKCSILSPPFEAAWKMDLGAILGAAFYLLRFRTPVV